MRKRARERQENKGFCSLKMIKCKRRQATDPQKLKNCQRSFSCFLLVEAEAVKAEVVEKQLLPHL